MPIKDTINFFESPDGKIPAFDKDAGRGKLFRAKNIIFKDFDKDDRCDPNADGEIYALKTHSQASDLVMLH